MCSDPERHPSSSFCRLLNQVEAVQNVTGCAVADTDPDSGSVCFLCLVCGPLIRPNESRLAEDCSALGDCCSCCSASALQPSFRLPAKHSHSEVCAERDAAPTPRDHADGPAHAMLWGRHIQTVKCHKNVRSSPVGCTARAHTYTTPRYTIEEDQRKGQTPHPSPPPTPLRPSVTTDCVLVLSLLPLRRLVNISLSRYYFRL